MRLGNRDVIGDHGDGGEDVCHERIPRPSRPAAGDKGTDS